MRTPRKGQWMVLGLALVLVAGAASLAWYLRERTTRVYTDAQTIRERAEEADLREILWQPATRLPVTVNTPGVESEPSVSLDGTSLYFVRGEPGRGTDLYVSVRTPRGWSEPEALDTVNSEADELGPAPAPDGSGLYFASDRAGGSGGYDLWMAPRTADGWGEAVNLGPFVNSAYHDFGPSLTPDGTEIYFASNRPGPGDTDAPPADAPRALISADMTQRDFDIYVAPVAADGHVREALAATELNTPAHEATPAVSPAGDFVYFSSDRAGGEGGFDIYRSRRLRGTHLAPQNLGDSLNTPANELDPALALGGFGVFFASDRVVTGDGVKDSDVYFAASREVFAELEAHRATIDWAGLWRQIWPYLLALLVALLALLALARVMLKHPEKLGRLSLIARCLLASLVVHLLLMLLLTVWEVTLSIADFIERGGGTRVILTSASTGAEIAGQIRGGLMDFEVEAPQDSAAARQSTSLEVETASAAAETAVAPAEIETQVALATVSEAADAPADALEATPLEHMTEPEPAAPADVPLPARPTPQRQAEARPATPVARPAPAPAPSEAAAAALAAAPVSAGVETNVAATPIEHRSTLAEAVTAREADPAQPAPPQPTTARLDRQEPTDRDLPIMPQVAAERAVEAQVQVQVRTAVANLPRQNPAASTEVAADPAPSVEVAPAPQTHRGDETTLASADPAVPDAPAPSAPLPALASSTTAAPNDREAVAVATPSNDAITRPSLRAHARAQRRHGQRRACRLTEDRRRGRGRGRAGGRRARRTRNAWSSPQPGALGDPRRRAEPDRRAAHANRARAEHCTGPGRAADRPAGRGRRAAFGGRRGEPLGRDALDRRRALRRGHRGRARRRERPGRADPGGRHHAGREADAGANRGAGQQPAARRVRRGLEPERPAGARCARDPGARPARGVRRAGSGGERSSFRDHGPGERRRTRKTGRPCRSRDAARTRRDDRARGDSDRATGRATRPDRGERAPRRPARAGARTACGDGDTSGRLGRRPGPATDGSRSRCGRGCRRTIRAGHGGCRHGAGPSRGAGRERRSGARRAGGAGPGAARYRALGPKPGDRRHRARFRPRAETRGATCRAAGRPGGSHAADHGDRVAGPGPAAAGGRPGRRRRHVAAGAGDGAHPAGPAAARCRRGQRSRTPQPIVGDVRAQDIRVAETRSLFDDAADAREVDPEGMPIRPELPDLVRLVGAELALELEIPSAGIPRAPHYEQRAPEVRKAYVEKFGGSKETEAAVALALEWLAQQQSRNGGWDSMKIDRRNGGAAKVRSDIALTGLSLLCFFAADHSHIKDGPYQDTVERGLRWLIAQQETSGSLIGPESMYSHGIATIALAEAYGMTGDPALARPAAMAANFIYEARNRTIGGWRYEPGQAGDTSVLGWQIMALTSAKRAGVPVPEEAFRVARRWLDKVERGNTPGLYAYQPKRRVTPAMTAEALFVHQLIGTDPAVGNMDASAAYILNNPPDWDREANTYYWYYATLALFQHGGDAWDRWNRMLLDQVLDRQRHDGELAGSWDPDGKWANVGGRVYQTAICTLTLEVYYRYLPLYVNDPASPLSRR